MKISIAVTTYNGERYIGEQLRSFAEQSRTPDEVIVCDDNSKDGTVGVVKQFAESAPFPIKLHENKPGLGVIKNFERSVSLCTGDLIFLSDHDDFWLPNKLATHEAVFAANPNVGHVFSNGTISTENLQSRGITMFQSSGVKPSRIAAINKGGLLEAVLRAPRLYGCTMSFRSSLREVLIPFRGNCLHDTWIGLMAAIFTDTRALPQPLMLYRTHARQTVGYPKDQAETPPITRARDQLTQIDADLGTFEIALEMVQRHRALVRHPRAERLLRGKIAHMHARADLGRELPARVQAFGRELLNGNYLRFSSTSNIKSDAQLCATPEWGRLRAQD